MKTVGYLVGSLVVLFSHFGYSNGATVDLAVIFNSQDTNDLFGVVEFPGDSSSSGSSSSSSDDSDDDANENVVTVLDLLEFACVEENLDEFCVDFDLSLRSGYGYYVECIADECELATQSIYWFVYINDELVDLSLGINNINVENGDCVKLSLESYFDGFDCDTIDRPPVILNDSIVSNNLLGVWYAVRISNLLYTAILSDYICTSETFTLENENIFTDIDVIVRGYLANDTQLQNELVLNTLKLTQLQDNLGIYLGEVPQNPVPFVTKILYLTNTLQILWSCNENNPRLPGIWENINVYSKNPSITNDELNEIFNALYDIGVPATQIDLVDTTIGCGN